MLLGYARTSTSDQQAGLEDQIAELTNAGADRIFKEQVSSVSQRDELELQRPTNAVGAILKTQYGKAFSRNGYGNWFSKICDRAQLPKRCRSHGLRKAAAVLLAEAGCTTKEIMSITGHKSLSDVELYTRDADQKRHAESTMD